MTKLGLLVHLAIVTFGRYNPPRFNPHRDETMLRNSLFKLCSTTPFSYLRYSAQTVLSQPNPQNIAQLTKIRNNSQKELLTRQPYLMQEKFQGKIVYTACRMTPEEVIARGGITEGGKPTVINTETGHNDGCVSFSLSPQITALFYEYELKRSLQKQVHIYAFPLFGEVICPGKQWFEVISPNAFPLPAWWLARKIEKVHHNGKVVLGPLLGKFGRVPALEKGEDFHHFINNTITLPDLHYTGESMVFDVDGIATKYARDFKEKVSKHYEEAAPKRYPAYRT